MQHLRPAVKGKAGGRGGSFGTGVSRGGAVPLPWDGEPREPPGATSPAPPAAARPGKQGIVLSKNPWLYFSLSAFCESFLFVCLFVLTQSI